MTLSNPTAATVLVTITPASRLIYSLTSVTLASGARALCV